MNKGKYVFSQLLDFLDRNDFNYLARKYDGDKYVKQFTCYNQLATLMFGQQSNRESLRDVVLATQALAPKAYAIGFGKFVTRSNRKNQRKGGIKVHTLYDLETSIPTFFHITEARVNDMNAMDVIPYEENSFYIFDRGYNDFERLFRINAIGAYFIVRGKKNNDFKPMKWTRRFPPGSGILSDAIGYMNGELTRGKYPEKVRRIVYWDDERKRKFIFFTNALDISPMMVAELYHNRWQIELFFKWLKPHLKIKKFWGESENAVRIQIYTAITAYCMMAIVQKKMGINRPIYEMLQLVSFSLTKKTPLDKLFGKPNYNIVNDLDGSSEPSLF